MRLDQNKVDEDDNVVMLDILVGKALASRTLSEPNPFAERSIVCFAVCCV